MSCTHFLQVAPLKQAFPHIESYSMSAPEIIIPVNLWPFSLFLISLPLFLCLFKVFLFQLFPLVGIYSLRSLLSSPFPASPAGWRLTISASISPTWSCAALSTPPTWASTKPGRRKWWGAPGSTARTLFATGREAASITRPPSCRTHRLVLAESCWCMKRWGQCWGVNWCFLPLSPPVCVWREEGGGRGSDLLTAKREESHAQRGQRRKPCHRLWYPPGRNQTARAHFELEGCHHAVLKTSCHPAGGAQQEVPYALGPAESSGLHLHQLSLRLPQEGAEGGPLCHHSHNLWPWTAGRLLAPCLHWRAFRLQVNLILNLRLILHHSAWRRVGPLDRWLVFSLQLMLLLWPQTTKIKNK